MVTARIMAAAIKIQAVARGFITRKKCNRVHKLAYDYDKAKLNELLGSMQQAVKILDRDGEFVEKPESLVVVPLKSD